MDIIPLNQKKIFSQADATSLLPVIYRITEAAQKDVKHLVNRMEAIKGMSSSRASEIESENCG